MKSGKVLIVVLLAMACFSFLTPNEAYAQESPDMSVWIGKWFQVTRSITGFEFDGTAAVEQLIPFTNTITLYLLFTGIDATNRVLQADAYFQFGSDWEAVPANLYYGGSPLSFTALLKIPEMSDDAQAVVQITGKLKKGVLGSATLKTLGGSVWFIVWFEDKPYGKGGALKFTGKMISEDKVPPEIQ